MAPTQAAVQIDISLWVDAGTLFLVMEDNGHPFDPTADSSADLSSSLQDRQVGGLGLHLVKSFARPHRLRILGWQEPVDRGAQSREVVGVTRSAQAGLTCR